jgi:hypothetical protein
MKNENETNGAVAPLNSPANGKRMHRYPRGRTMHAGLIIELGENVSSTAAGSGCMTRLVLLLHLFIQTKLARVNKYREVASQSLHIAVQDASCCEQN